MDRNADTEFSAHGQKIRKPNNFKVFGSK